MALQMIAPFLSSFLPNPRHGLAAHGLTHQKCVSKHISCSTTTPTYSTTVPRRSGNYKPSIWDYDFVQSLGSGYKVEAHGTRVEKLKEVVKHLLKETDSSLAQIELIDKLHRLGLRWLFENEIKQVLYTISSNNTSIEMRKDLHAVSTRFRLLRQHGYKVSIDVFNDFKDEKGCFKPSLSMDIKGMLSLYEASHLAFQGETVLDEARAFASTHLMDIKENIDPILHKKVEYALDMPLHWRLEKLEARWYMDIYMREEGMNSSLLELAKLHFNIVQTTFQTNLKSLSRWWKDLGLGEQLSFTRDRLVECFFWAAAMTPEPQFGRCQEAVAKVAQLIIIIDDIYDVYGTVDELELFTNAIDRWDLEAMEQLPEYMKTCFLALYNSINEIGYEILKEEGRNVIPYLRNTWTELCKAFLVEAKWYSSGYTPTLEEYLQTSWISIGSLPMQTYVFALLGKNLAPESSDFAEKISDILPLGGMMIRLPDDLGTSTDELKRGDVPKSIQCYMHEAGVTEDVARDHIMGLFRETWKKLNEYLVESSLPHAFIDHAMNLGRVAYCTYKHGDGFSDGFGDPGSQEKKMFMSLFAEPLQVDEAKGISFYVDGGSA
ncbi:Geraniol synthase, chloroplastic [Cinnamomum micranthum f. kanehirae]|uniref:Geraniol synthase, chloroplastic n=2 Tax=Cinnamomum TaxID=13428 RepID=A0A3S3NMD7_9MAGN|nr:Geraniol synthase, chloroplastic [Cinnamomum micranthum f. kanehirae]